MYERSSRFGFVLLLASIVALSSANTARADAIERGDAGWKKAAWGGLITTGGMLLGVGVAVNRVHDREEQRVLDLEDVRSADPSSAILEMPNACAAADADSTALTSDLRATCASGRRWATISNLFMAGTALATAFTGYAVYRGYIKRRGGEGTVTVSPHVSTAGGGVSLSLDF